MDVLTLAMATALEMRAVLDGLGLALEPPAEMEAVEVDARGRRLRLLVTGVGPINAAMAAGRHLANGDVAGLLNLGLAGSFDLAKHPLGDAVLVDREIWPEYGLRSRQGVDARGLAFPLLRHASGDIHHSIDLLPDDAAQTMNLRVAALPRATGLTVAGVSADPDTARHMAETYAADVENMEGFALALACRRLDIPFLEMRSISNLVGKRDGWRIPEALTTLGTVASHIFSATIL